MQRRGFSLSEMIIAMLILSTVSVALVGVLPASVSGTRAAGDRAFASVVAWQALESLRASAPAAIVDGDLPSVSNRGVTYAVHVTTSPVLAADGTAMAVDSARGVEVRVTWKDRANLECRYVLTGTVLRH